MDKNDVAAIKLGSAAFTKKWWEDRRGLLAGGCGVGRALADWERYCPVDPDTIEDSALFVVAAETGSRLKGALLKAKKKCGRLDKSTGLACDAYLGEIDAYVRALAKAEDAFAAAEAKALAKTKEIDEALANAVERLRSLCGDSLRIANDLDALDRTTDKARERANTVIESPLSVRGGSARDLATLREDAKRIADTLARQGEEVEKAAAPVLELLRKSGTARPKDGTKVFSGLVDELRRQRNELTGRLSGLRDRVADALDLSRQAEETANRASDRIEALKDAFWTARQGSANHAKAEIAEIANAAVALVRQGAKPDPDGKQDRILGLEAAVTRRARLGSIVDDLRRTIRDTAEEARRAKGDREMTRTVKEMVAELKGIEAKASKLDRVLGLARSAQGPGI